MIAPGYHWRDGWFFLRLDDGSVRIRKHAGNGAPENEVLVEAVIPVAEWGSVVSSVSKSGETYESWMAAQEFHNK